MSEQQIASDKYREWVENFTNKYDALISAYTPQYGNTATKDVNVHPVRPKKEDLRKWFLSPQNYEEEMRNFSLYMYYAITEYRRLNAHIGNILSFDYVLVPLNTYKADDESRFKHNEKKCHTWLERFRVKDQLRMITPQIVLKGGKFYYLRLAEDNILLQEMPEDYCYITGRGEVSWRFAVDMTFFDKYPTAIEGYAPEFGEWYKEFDYRRRYERNYYIYQPMPVEKSVVFKVDEFSPLISPVLAGTFKDALQIEDYKDLLRMKTELDTWKVVFQTIPKDRDGIPVIDEMLATKFVNMVQNQLPTGVVTAATPFDIEPVSFDQTQNMNTVVGRGQDLFWGNSGSAPLFDGKQTGNYAMRMSIMSDYLLVSQLYNQYERFINYHLNMICKEYKFGIKFLRRCSYFEDEDTETYFSQMQGGAPPELYMASRGFEPYQVKSFLENSIKSGIRNYFVPTASAHTMSNKDKGADTKTESKLTDSGATTADRGDNQEKL